MVRGMDVVEDTIPAGCLASLAQSKAEIESGQTVPLEPILDELRASIACMRARRQKAQTDQKA